MNISYDEMLHISPIYDTLVRGHYGGATYRLLLLLLITGYKYQNHDNVTLLDDELLIGINDVIGPSSRSPAFKKNGKTGGEEVALRCKTDSFVVETDTHFPYRLQPAMGQCLSV